MSSHYLLENGSGAWLLENRTGYLLLENAFGVLSNLWKQAPQNFALVVNGQASVSLSWTPITSALVIGYYVWRDGVLLTPLPVTGGSYTDATVVAGHRYNYAVTAVDVNLNYSQQTPTLRAEVLQAGNLYFEVSWAEQPGMAGRPDLQWRWF